MKIIAPMAVTNTEFTASNQTEADHAEWDISTTYAAEAKIIVIGTTHKIYESAQGSNIGNDPVTDDGTWWLETSATNRWKAFDLKIADPVNGTTSITYSITPSELVTGLAFFGLEAATVQVEIYDTDTALIYDVTKDLIDDTDVVDWFSFFFGGVVYDSEALFIDIPAYSGFQIDITVAVSSGAVAVGQIVPGRAHVLGVSLDGTTIGIEDFSTKSRDAFGNATIVERAFIDETEFQFSLPTANARWVKRRLSAVRATPAVYFSDEDTVRHGTTVYGFFQDFSIPLSSGGTSFATLEIEGLV